MRVAILGAGFSGLSVAWHLLASEATEVVIYDPKGVGGGASGIATGLMHPYAGEQGRRSELATEGLQASKALIEMAEKKLNVKIAISHGIIRHVQTKEQKQMFLSHCQKYGDVKPYGDEHFWIESGVTVDCPLYLEGLWQMVAEMGAQLICSEVLDLNTLSEFDHIVIASGAGVKKFPELNSLAVSVVKGQVLKCQAPEDVDLLSFSAIGKGYVALSSETRTCHVGSTYERDDLTENPNPEVAKLLLFEKISAFFQKVDRLKIIDCKAALRVVRRGHYFPIVGKVKEKLWVMAAMGSRGLLYHAYLGKLLANSILANNSDSTLIQYATR